MFSTDFINEPIEEVEHIFREHNQLTSIYYNLKLIRSFGSNEGGPSYEIHVDSEGMILEIKVNSNDHFY